MPKRVLLVDDNAGVRSLVRQLFDLEPSFEIAGEAGNGREGLDKAEILRPDLVILDLSMPVMTGLDAAVEIRKLLPEARIILFTVHQGSEVDRLAREAGIHAVVSKNDAVSKLIIQALALVAPRDKGSDSDKLRNAS